eukprot:TRINITY_DN5094_c0_g1_i6.p1 TRINITY_DN5094_c0_g1~~TRINITY_DN5094_c0_g1_i6.p1  ORF type:complete len:624 (+),score=127.88 TRINITY_DN5094_c0_g1_i6:831-2702(+)
MNSLRPGAIRKYHENPKISVVKLENMNQFLRSLKTKFGFSDLQLMQASDLCSGQCDIKRLLGLLIAVKLKTEDTVTPSVLNITQVPTSSLPTSTFQVGTPQNTVSTPTVQPPQTTQFVPPVQPTPPTQTTQPAPSLQLPSTKYTQPSQPVQQPATSQLQVTPSLSRRIEEIISVLKSIRGCEIITPEHKKYSMARAVYNKSHNNLPHFIVRPRSTQDVCQIVKIVKPSGFKLSVKARGHSLSGTSVVDDTILLDMVKMKSIWVDQEIRTVSVAAGIKWIDVHRAVDPFVVVAPHDSGSGIGALLGGATGPLLNSHGLSLDTIVSIEIVTADGQAKLCSQTSNEDLFWALKGGGVLNFGIVTNVTLEIFNDVPPLLYSITRTWPNTKMVDMLCYWSSIYERIEDRNIVSKVSMDSSGLRMTNLYLGQTEDAIDTLNLFELPSGSTSVVEQKGPLSFLDWNESNYLKSSGKRFALISGIFPSLDETMVQSLVHHMTTVPQPGGDIIKGMEETVVGHVECTFEWFFGTVCEVSAHYASFPHREFGVEISCFAEYRSREIEWKNWLEGLFGTIRSECVGATIHNSPKDVPDYKQLFYGESYEGLQAVKIQHDSSNFFSSANGINPSD